MIENVIRIGGLRGKMKKICTIGVMVCSAFLLSGCPAQKNPEAPAPSPFPSVAMPYMGTNT